MKGGVDVKESSRAQCLDNAPGNWPKMIKTKTNEKHERKCHFLKQNGMMVNASIVLLLAKKNAIFQR